MKLSGRSHPSPADRAEIIQMRKSKPWLWSHQSLAEHFGTTRWTVRNICKAAARNDLENAITTFAAIAKETA